MDIEKRILELLYFKECVIIPGLGGFVSRYMPARIKKESQTILPPSRKFVFNSVMIQDDGILAAYIARCANTDIASSKAVLDEYVGSVLSLLASDGRYFIPSIGVLSYARTGELIFTAEEGVNFLLDSFGLSSIHYSLTDREEGKGRIVSLPSVKYPEQRQKTVRRLAIALPLLLAVSLLPMNSSKKMMHNNASFFSMPSLSITDIGQGISTGDTNNEPIPHSENADQGTFDKGSFAVVAGSFSSRKNAEVLHSDLTEKGFYNEIWEASNGFFRVVVQAHENMSTAQEAVAKLREELKDIEFWILH